VKKRDKVNQGLLVFRVINTSLESSYQSKRYKKSVRHEAYQEVMAYRNGLCKDQKELG